MPDPASSRIGYWDYLRVLAGDELADSISGSRFLLPQDQAWHSLTRPDELQQACQRAVCKRKRGSECLRWAWTDANSPVFEHNVKRLLFEKPGAYASWKTGLDVEHLFRTFRGVIRAAQIAWMIQHHDLGDSEEVSRFVVEAANLLGRTELAYEPVLRPAFDQGTESYFGQLRASRQKTGETCRVAAAQDCVQTFLSTRRPGRLSTCVPILWYGEELDGKRGGVCWLHLEYLTPGFGESFADPLHMALVPAMRDFLHAAEDAWVIARKVAADILGELPAADIRWWFSDVPELKKGWPHPLQGESAGAAMTSAMVQLLCGQPGPSDCAITASVDEFGGLHAVGGLEYKIPAALQHDQDGKHRVHSVLVCGADKKKAEDAAQTVGRREAVVSANRVEDACDWLERRVREKFGDHAIQRQLRIPEDFVERSRLTQAVKEFLESEESGFLVVVGGMGRGKTSWLAKLVDDAQRDGEHPIHRFISNYSDESPDEVARSLVEQLRYKHPTVPEPADDRKKPYTERLQGMLERLNERLGKHGGREVIYLDAADQANTTHGTLLLPGLLRPLPPRVYCIITTRPDYQRWLGIAAKTLDLNDYIDDRQDVRVWLRRQTARYGLPLQDEFVERSVQQPDPPVFMTVADNVKSLRKYNDRSEDCTELVSDPKLWVRSPEECAQNEWQRVFKGVKGETKRQFRMMAGVLALAGELLTPDILEQLGLWDQITEEFLDRARNFFRPWDGDDAHASIEFDHPGYIRAILGESPSRGGQLTKGGRLSLSVDQQRDCLQLLVDRCSNWRKLEGHARIYALRQLPRQLISAEMWSRLEELLCDLEYLEAKVAAGRAHDLPNDYRHAVVALPSDRPRKRMLAQLGGAVDLDIEFIAAHAQDYPQALFQCLWNRCHGAPDSVLPDDPPGRPLSDERLSDLLSRWLAHKTAATPGFRWLRLVWRTNDPRQQALLYGLGGSVEEVAFSPRGDRIAAGSAYGTVWVWDVHNRVPLSVLSGQCSMVFSVAFSPDGCRIASGHADGTVRIWDVRGGPPPVVLTGHQDLVSSVSFSPDGGRIVSTSRHEVCLWDAYGRAEQPVLRKKWQVASACFSPGGDRIAIASYDDMVRVWDARSLTELVALVPHAVGGGDQSGIASVSFSPDENRVAGGSGDGTIRVWDARSGTEVAVLRGHEYCVESVAYSPNGDQIVSGSWDGTVRLWDIHTGEELAVLRGHETIVNHVAFSPDGARIASSSDDLTIRIWNVGLASGQMQSGGWDYAVTTFAFSRCGDRVAGGLRDSTVCIWDVSSGKQLAVCRARKGWIAGVDHPLDEPFDDDDQENAQRAHEGHFDVVFSPDGERIASWSSDNNVRVWNARSGGEELLVLREPEWILWASGRFTTEGVRIRSASYDAERRLWHEVTGEPLEARMDCGQSDAGLDEAEATASGRRALVWRRPDGALGWYLETANGGTPVAWFPDGLNMITPHPSGRMWAGIKAKSQALCILALEGAE